MPTVTIKTVSQQLGLSVSTVSKALNGYSDISPDTRQRIIEAAQKLGYMPNQVARNLVKKTTNTVGVIIPDIATSIYGEIFRSLGEAARASGVNLFLCDTNRNKELEKVYVRNILETQAMGMIVAPISSDITHINELVQNRIPVVYIGGKVETDNENFVSSNNIVGANMAMDYLFSLGHSDIAALSDNDESVSCQSRVRGYSEAMKRRGMLPRILIERNRKLSAQESGYALARHLLTQPKLPTAVFAIKDMVAVGVIQAFNEAGLSVPDDISVIGYDDILVSSIPMLSLTTVAQPKREMGEVALEILLDRVKNNRDGKRCHHYAQPMLIERKSCARPAVR